MSRPSPQQLLRVTIFKQGKTLKARSDINLQLFIWLGSYLTEAGVKDDLLNGLCLSHFLIDGEDKQRKERKNPKKRQNRGIVTDRVRME